MMQGYALLLGGRIDEGRVLVDEAKSLYIDEHERRGLQAGYPMLESMTWWDQMGAWLAGDATCDDESSSGV